MCKKNVPLITRIAFFQYFQKELPGKVEADVEGLFNLAYSIKINPKKMKKMEKDYAELRKKEQEEMVELRVRQTFATISGKTFAETFNSDLQRLRNENRLLKKRNELLEAESTELANRLVRGQVSRAEEEETKSVFDSRTSEPH